MAKVYVTQDDPGKNLTAACAFGELVKVFPMRQVAFDTKTHADTIRKNLEQFNGQEDYILLIGDPVVIAMTAAIIAEEWSSFKVLKWDKQNHTYYPITINLE